MPGSGQEPELSYREAEMIPFFFFVPDNISNVTKVLPLTQSPPQDPKAPSNAERP